MTAKYFIRPRAEKNPKLWQGPFDTPKLKELADRRLFSKELHEYSEDRLNWISARQIWPTLFPKAAKTLLTTSQSIPTVTAGADSGSQPAASSGVDSKAAEAAPAAEEAPEWYCSSGDTQQGPYTLSQLRAYVSQGRVQVTDLVWCPQFGEQWVEAQSVSELFQPAGQGLSFNESNTKSSKEKTPPLAVASLVCGLLGATCMIGLGSILAIIFGHIALAQYHRPNASKNGKGMAIAGVCLGYAMLAILFMALVVYLALT